MSAKRFNVECVIFDMDGVITNTMPDHFKAWAKVMQEEGVHVTHEDIYSREGQRGLQSVKELFAKYQKPYNPKKAKAMLASKEAEFKRCVRKRFIPGARSFIKKLKNKGITLALVTGTSRHEMREILPDTVYNSFSVCVTGCEVKNGKPHPEPYRKALKKLNLKPAEAVVIENAPFGIKSAKRAGLRCIAVETSLPKDYLKEADTIFSSIKDIDNKVEFSKNV